MSDASSDWAQHIEAIESGYEFMLAYAAQGQIQDDPTGAGSQIRQFLGKMDTALEGLGDSAERLAKEKGHSAYQDFLAAMRADAEKARAGINLVLAKSVISSQLIDNLNASIHLRTLLTDLFLIDEALK